jgi:hypothetical protein
MRSFHALYSKSKLARGTQRKGWKRKENKGKEKEDAL